jgi:hypothetical protein
VIKSSRGDTPPALQPEEGGSTWTIQEVEELTLLLRQPAKQSKGWIERLTKIATEV